MIELFKDFCVWLSGPYLPVDGGGFSSNVDFLVGFIALVCYFFVAVIGTLMVWFSVRYRQRNKQDLGQGAHHSTPIEIAWTLPPLVIVIFIFAVGFTGFLDMATPPKGGNAYEVRAEAFQWGWNFYYPNGAVSDKLYIPSDRPTKLTLESKDVIHSLYIPAFRAKKDCVPGRFNVMWFEPRPEAVSSEEGMQETAYVLHCTEYCGISHSKMNTEVVVVDPSYWDERQKLLKVWNRNNLPPAELGKEIWEGRGGCASCHSVTGSVGTGPSWKDLYGDPNHQLVSGGPIKADDTYILESIRNPNVKYAAGFPQGGMQAYSDAVLNAGDIRAIIEFMKTISVHAGNAPELEAFPEGYEGLEPVASTDAPGADKLDKPAPVTETDGDVESKIEPSTDLMDTNSEMAEPDGINAGLSQ